MKFNKWVMASIVIGSGLILSACGGSNPPEVRVAGANAVAVINPTTGPSTVAAFTGQTFTYATPVALSGVQNADGTAAAPITVTSVKFGGTVAAPTFEMASDKGALTGNLTFGSCIFTVVLPIQLAGQKITVTPCTVTFATAGVTANGNNSTANGTLTLGATASQPVSVTLSISPAGTITVGGQVLAVSVPIVTGTGG